MSREQHKNFDVRNIIYFIYIAFPAVKNWNLKMAWFDLMNTYVESSERRWLAGPPVDGDHQLGVDYVCLSHVWKQDADQTRSALDIQLYFEFRAFYIYKQFSFYFQSWRARSAILLVIDESSSRNLQSFWTGSSQMCSQYSLEFHLENIFYSNAVKSKKI